MQFCNEQTRAQPLFSPPCASATYGSARMSRRKNTSSIAVHNLPSAEPCCPVVMFHICSSVRIQSLMSPTKNSLRLSPEIEGTAVRLSLVPQYQLMQTQSLKKNSEIILMIFYPIWYCFYLTSRWTHKFALQIHGWLFWFKELTLKMPNHINHV